MTIDRRRFDPYAPAPLIVPRGDANPAKSEQPAETAQDAKPEQGAAPQDTAPALPAPGTEHAGGSDDAKEAATQLPGDLDDITKTDLVALAELAGVATYGTKLEIAGRIRLAAAGE